MFYNIHNFSLQVFLENPQTPGKFTTILPPVCSTSIFDTKAKKELQIMDISDTVSPAEGGKKIIILCEKVTREDIKVRFYDSQAWVAWGEFNPSEVHKQYAISMKTPRYKDVNIKEKTNVFIELVKPTDESTSEPQNFYYLPTDPGKVHISCCMFITSTSQDLCKQACTQTRNQITQTSKCPRQTILMEDVSKISKK